MSHTFAPCASCGRLNRVDWESSLTKEPLCGACKSKLPVHFGVVEASGSGLSLLVRKSALPVLCDFWAPWCGPCKVFAPVFQQAALKLGGEVVLSKLNTEAHPLASDAYGVRSIPTLIYFSGGMEQARVSGALPLEQLLDWISSHTRK